MKGEIMLSQEVINQFIKDIHGEEGKTILLIFADYLEENGVDWGLRRRKVRNVGINIKNAYSYGLECNMGYGCGYNYGYSSGNGNGICNGNKNSYGFGWDYGSYIGHGYGE